MIDCSGTQCNGLCINSGCKKKVENLNSKSFSQQNSVELTMALEKHQDWQNEKQVNTLHKSQGTKHDQGKPDLSHISLELMEQVARVREFGARKYSRDNWRKGFLFNRSIAAALRHILAFKEGENLDPESGLSHIAHAVCCLEHLMNDIKNHPENDDRDKSK